MKKFLVLLFIFTFIVSGCSKTKTNQALAIGDESYLETSYKIKPELSRPKAEKPIDNIFIALNELNTSSNYESFSSGEVKAKKGSFTLATQKINSKKIVTPSATFSESISISSLVKVAEQLYITNDKILKRESKKVSNAFNVSWKDKASELTLNQYLNEYGYSIKNPSRYIINEKTIVSDIEIINNGTNRKYTYKFNLDPTIAPYYYKTSIKSLSNSSSDPIFESIEIEMTFDYKWRMTEIVTNEIYNIQLPTLGKVTCYATLTETFKNFNRSTYINEELFFFKYL